jgi:hypothetical protein
MALLMTMGLAIPYGRTVIGAQPDSPQPYLGVLLDMSPLPELLTKHLRLSPGQGVRIKNIQKNSPAEDAGLDRDDIIVRIKDKDVYKYETVVLTVQDANVGEELPLEIIHLGQRKSMKIKLGSTVGEPEWIYPPEPELEQSWRPGRLFRLKPGDNNWAQIFSGDIPAELKDNMEKIFNEFRFYSDSQGYQITIEGDPKDENSTITISKGDTKHQTTIKELDKLPREYREAAERVLEKARQDKNDNPLWNSIQPPTDAEKFFQQPSSQQQLLKQLFQPDNQMLDKITEQMNQLMERMKELEKSQSELLERLTEKQQMQKTQKQQEPLS